VLYFTHILEDELDVEGLEDFIMANLQKDVMPTKRGLTFKHLRLRMPIYTLD